MAENRLNPYVDTPSGLRLHVNPGSGPVDEASEVYANKNITQLIEDIGLEGLKSRRDSPEDYGEGRYAYQLIHNQRYVEVQMPGLPLERVRDIEQDRTEGGFARLYVNGSSWFWKYAVDIIKNIFENPDEE